MICVDTQKGFIGRQDRSLVCRGHIPGRIIHRDTQDKESHQKSNPVSPLFIVVGDPQWEKPLKQRPHTHHQKLRTRQEITDAMPAFLYDT